MTRKQEILSRAAEDIKSRILLSIIPTRKRFSNINPFQNSYLVNSSCESLLIGEGIARIDDRIIGITWKEQSGFIFQMNNNRLRQIKSFSYHTSNNEGWGMCYDSANDYIIVSDGSCHLMAWDKNTLKEIERKCIMDGSKPVQKINELEYINGKVYANIWFSDKIAVINWNLGVVEQWIDFSKLKSWIKPQNNNRYVSDAVLNGIAFNSQRNTLYVTGKLWNRMFEIRLLYPL